MRIIDVNHKNIFFFSLIIIKNLKEFLGILNKKFKLFYKKCNLNFSFFFLENIVIISSQY